MLSSVPNSEHAVQMSIIVIRAFKKLKQAPPVTKRRIGFLSDK